MHPSETSRDVDQQKHIEQGLQSGQLSSGEARKLEAGESRIDKTEQRDLRNDSLSASERAQIQREQDRESKAVYNQKHDARTGNPDSLKSNMEQANVQRNINQQQRLHNGVKNGSVTNRDPGARRRQRVPRRPHGGTPRYLAPDRQGATHGHPRKPPHSIAPGTTHACGTENLREHRS